MRIHCFKGTWQSRRALLILLAALLPMICSLQPAPAASGSPIIRVEEDWAVEIIEPATDETSPQITNTISPTNDLKGFYGVFELNHGTQPDYDDGGLEVQIWQGPTEVIYNRFTNTNRLSYNNETVTYTVAMSVSKSEGRNILRVSIRNGNSQTWGQFGTTGNFRCSVQDTDVDDLSGYTPQFSVDNSKIGYASFRVNKFSLKAVRYYTSDGLVATDNTERVVFQYNPNAVISE